MTVNVQHAHSESTDGTRAQPRAAQLRALCSTSSLADQTEQVMKLFEQLQAASNSQSSHAAAVGDGLSPFDFSVTPGDSPELQLVLELKGGAAGVQALLSELGKTYPIAEKRFQLIEALYFPPSPRPAFAPRLAVTVTEKRAPRFELYLDPCVSGATLAPLCVERTLVHLGFGAAWPIIGQRLMRRGPDSDALKYVLVGLSSSAPRVAVYARHLNASVSDLELALAPCPAHRPGDVQEFLKSLAIRGETLSGLAALTRYEFSESRSARPSGVALEFPICGYAPSDLAINEAVLASLQHFGLAREAYSHALTVMASGAVGQGLGLQSHVAFERNQNGQARLTVRFPAGPGASAVANPTTLAPLSGVMEVVDRYEEWDQITNHPFLHRLRSEPVNLHHIWYILANFQASISKTFSQRLALIASRIDDPETRFIVTDLLYDEMGSGDYSLAHVNLFSTMMKVMEPWKPAVVDSWALGAGAHLNQSMDESYGNADINVALGAIVSGEIFGKQFDQFLGDEIRRQTEVDPALFVWVTLHESLEVTHAGEGADIAKLVPPAGLQAMAEGAYRLSLGAWAFLTDVYEICYCERPTS